MTVAAKVRGAAAKRVIALVPVLLVGIVLLMVVPLPAIMLDLLLACSIALSVTLMLTSIHMRRPLDLSSFPTILLFATLLRLALNVASTRLILLHGSEGTGAAGHVIQSFGQFVVGGNYVVGAAVFLLLVIINFVVITKGAGRVAEVSARFTLDALPGKQMSVDADLAAGSITQEQAKARRRDVEREADFFGAMDGASKFVRGDAVAGLIMTGINIVIGFVVGVAQQGMSASAAASTYTVLTVGDGLASQIPALVVSVAAGVVVTRAAAGGPIASALVDQLGSQHKPLFATATVLGVVGLLPGMPAIPFFALAAGIAYAARATKDAAGVVPEEAPETPVTGVEKDQARIQELLYVDLLELQVGFDLVPMVDASSGGDLVERITAIRNNLASELGIIVPSIHIRDNLELPSSTYCLLLSGSEVGRGSLRIGRMLAMDPTGSLASIEGERVREPAFGLPAQWIREPERGHAETLGYTVVDAATVAATHITELLRAAAPDLLGRAEAQELLDLFAQRQPRLVDELIPNQLTLGEVIVVLRGLLAEGVSIRDLRTVLEALADTARESKDVGVLIERVRARLARQITARFKGAESKVAALVMDPRAEDVFRNGGPDSGASQRLLSSLDTLARAFAGVKTPPLILSSSDVRRAVYAFMQRHVPGISVVAFDEIDKSAAVRTLGVLTS